MHTAFRDLTIQLIDALWSNPAAAYVVVPVTILAFVMRFLRWSNSLSRGASLDDLQSDLSDRAASLNREQLQARYRQSRRPRR